MLPSASTPAVVDVYHMDMRDRLPMHKATYHIESTPSEVYAGFFVAVKDEKEKPDPFYIIRLMKLRQDAYDFLKWSRKGNSWVEDENWLYTSGKQDLPWIHWGRKFFTKNAARLTAIADDSISSEDV